MSFSEKLEYAKRVFRLNEDENNIVILSKVEFDAYYYSELSKICKEYSRLKNAIKHIESLTGISFSKRFAKSNIEHLNKQIEKLNSKKKITRLNLLQKCNEILNNHFKTF
jgi:hypothetical protein